MGQYNELPMTEASVSQCCSRRKQNIYQLTLSINCKHVNQQHIIFRPTMQNSFVTRANLASSSTYQYIAFFVTFPTTRNHFWGIPGKTYNFRRNLTRNLCEQIYNCRELVVRAFCKLLRANCQSKYCIKFVAEVCKVAQKRTSSLTVKSYDFAVYSPHWLRESRAQIRKYVQVSQTNSVGQMFLSIIS